MAREEGAGVAWMEMRSRGCLDGDEEPQTQETGTWSNANLGVRRIILELTWRSSA